MKPTERSAFSELITDVLAFFRRDVSDFTMSVWWEACSGFDLEQVRRALTAHAMDAERGRYCPMPADIVAQLQGTRTDRALVAWSKVLEAMQRIGAYTSVVFDDPSIHAAVEDVGGWITICRTDVDELPHLERRFCKSYTTYTKQPGHAYPQILPGVHQLENATAGQAIAPPMLVGNAQAAASVMAMGSSQPKTQITDGRAIPAVAALTLARSA